MSARRNAGEMVRVVRPTSRGSDRPWVMMRAIAGVAGESFEGGPAQRGAVRGFAADLADEIGRAAVFERFEVDHDRHVRRVPTLGPRGVVGGTNLDEFHERVGALLPLGALVSRRPVLLHNRADRGEDPFALFGVEEAVDGDHPVERPRQVQVAAVELVVGTRGAAAAVEGVGDPLHDLPQLGRRDLAGDLDQGRFDLGDRVDPRRGRGPADHFRMRPGDLAGRERFRGCGQRLQPPREVHRRACESGRDVALLA